MYTPYTTNYFLSIWTFRFDRRRIDFRRERCKAANPGLFLQRGWAQQSAGWRRRYARTRFFASSIITCELNALVSQLADRLRRGWGLLSGNSQLTIGETRTSGSYQRHISNVTFPWQVYYAVVRWPQSPNTQL